MASWNERNIVKKWMYSGDWDATDALDALTWVHDSSNTIGTISEIKQEGGGLFVLAEKKDSIALYRDSYFCKKYLKIKKVIFNAPATIVFWEDGTKTVVKCGENDTYDKEKGLAMCIAKRALGDKGNYYNEFKKLIEDEK